MEKREINKRYYDLRKSLGWKPFYRFVPSDLYDLIDDLVDTHKKRHPETWKAPKMARKLSNHNLKNLRSSNSDHVIINNNDSNNMDAPNPLR
jgi:hypothetical protein